MVASYVSDKAKMRGPQFVIFGLISIVGYIIALTARKEQNNLYVTRFPKYTCHSLTLTIHSVDMPPCCKSYPTLSCQAGSYANTIRLAHSLQIFGGPGLSPGLSAWMVDVSQHYLALEGTLADD